MCVSLKPVLFSSKIWLFIYPISMAIPIIRVDRHRKNVG